MKRAFAPIITVTAVVAFSTAAFGALSNSEATADLAMTMAAMPDGSQPTAGASGNDVTLNWEPRELAGSPAAGGYMVRRYDSTGVLVGGCSGTVHATTCTEVSVPPGNWSYAVTPVFHSWTGAESTRTSVTAPEGT